MKRIIDGRVYDTATGELIHEVSRGHPGDFAYFEEGLYRSPKGQYFLAGHGGPATHYARALEQLDRWGPQPAAPDRRRGA